MGSKDSTFRLSIKCISAKGVTFCGPIAIAEFATVEAAALLGSSSFLATSADCVVSAACAVWVG